MSIVTSIKKSPAKKQGFLVFDVISKIYLPPDSGQPTGLSTHFAGAQAPAAAGFAFALLAQQLLLPEAAGFALALLEQQLLLPEAAGFALAVAIGQAAVPALSQDFFMSEHFDGSQFAGSHLEPLHCIAVALALTFSVLLQPITAKPSAATRVRVSSCFIIIFLQKRCERGKNDLSDVLYSI